MALAKVVQAIRRQLRRRLKIDVVGIGNTATLRFHLEDVLRAYRIDTIIDVGANEGQFGGLVREIGFRGDIHSFEPVRQTYERLAVAAASDERWQTHNLALGREAGTLQINVSEGSVFSSMLKPNAYGAGKFEAIKVQRREDVEVVTLKSFFDKHIGRDRRVLLKMDTQGYDLEVLEGAGGAIDDVCCILSELSLIPIYDGMPDFLEALGAYRRKGFSVSGLYPVNWNDDRSLIEVDCMMVNRRRFPS